MTRFIIALFLVLSLFLQSAQARQTKWILNKTYENEVTWEKNIKIKLPPGEVFTLMYRDYWFSWGIDINSKWLISTKGNLYHQDLSLDRIGSTKYLAYLKIIYEEIFFKNKYDGCYPRSEYTVMKRRKKGGFFNCFIVRHIDVNKALYAPDDPETTTNHAKHVFKKYNLELPPILLCYESIFYAPSITEVVLSPQWCINPETNGASKTLYTSEETSEYHPQNIRNYPDKKKFMDNFIKLAAQRHKHFEKELKAKEKHKIDLTEFGVGETIEESKTMSSSGDITVEIKELYELYKEGVLTKEEFEKGKKKLLN